MLFDFWPAIVLGARFVAGRVASVGLVAFMPGEAWAGDGVRLLTGRVPA